ncbi:chitotriosidase-1-like [Physella acuta]|uniref:chitotriosidase-1-like n=1 Tax=Physella acuta TaxID=109671 RepID=UPI0027DC26C2|nr:chitotriosidase-1-like [Physella acuta]
MCRLSFVLLVSALVAGALGATCQRRVCYHTNWSQYRTQPAQFLPSNINASLCTHIIYAFAKLSNNQLAPFEWNDDDTATSKGMYSKFNDLKLTNPQLKTLLAVGGYNLGTAPFSQMAATPTTRARFIQTAIKFLRDRKFDGLDLDWEYPALRGSPAGDAHLFTLLVQETVDAFDLEQKTSGKPKLLLSAAVAAGKETVDVAYEISAIASKLDFINLMSYDFHGSWDPVTGHNSPLYAGLLETGAIRNYNVDFAAKYWVSKGALKSKINIGLPTYGRSFTLSSVSKNNTGDPAAGAGPAGRFTQEPGSLSYYEICEMISQGATVRRSMDQQVPYLVKGSVWVGYDDPVSLRNKVKYIKDNGYGGSMLWTLDQDDFTGTFCGQGKFPLTTAVSQECLDVTSG